MAFLDENGVAQLWAAVKDRLAGAFDNVEFDVAKQAANLVSGDSIATAFGKLAKNYTSILTSISDLNTTLGNRISEMNTSLTSQINTKLNKSDVLANYTTTETGKALDASLGPAIKTKMDLADTLNTEVNKIKSRSVLYQWGHNSAPAYHTWFNGASITLPANSGRWLVLANINVSNYGDEVNLVCTFEVLPSNYASTMVRNASRVTTGSGGGCTTWGYATAYNQDRTIYVHSYVYDNIVVPSGSTPISYDTVICAINLG